MSTDEIFTMRFKELCEKSNITQADMAYRLNITQSALSKQINGKRKVSTDILVKISDFFQTSTDYLLGKSDNVRLSIPLEERSENYLPPEVASSYALLENEGKQIVNTMIVYLAGKRSNL